MHRGFLAVVFLVVGSVAPAMAQDGPRVIDRAFKISIAQKDGSFEELDTTQVPLLPGRACFQWYIEVEGVDGPVELVEVLQLPAPAGSWGAPDSRLSNDLTSAKTQRVLEPLEGWISTRWCLAEGDPVGPHSITVSAGSWLHERFEFEVVEP